VDFTDETVKHTLLSLKRFTIMFPLMFPLRNLFSNAARLPRPAVFNYRLHSVLKGDTTTPKLIGLHEIQRTKDLLERVAATNRPQEKKDIIAEYPDLRGVIDLFVFLFSTPSIVFVTRG
jgi:hypothetical protein